MKNWPFKDVLEKRIESAKEIVLKFRLPIDNSKTHQVDDVILINSAISCESCHKMSNEDLTTYKIFDWKKYKDQKNVYWMNK